MEEPELFEAIVSPMSIVSVGETGEIKSFLKDEEY